MTETNSPAPFPASLTPGGALTPGEAVARRTVTSYTLTPAELRTAGALYRSDLALSVASTALTFAVLAAMLLLRFGPRVERLARSISRRRLVQAAVVVPLIFLTYALFELPLALCGHHIALGFGLSVEGWGAWLADWAKSEALALLLATLCLWGLYALIRRSPRRWWLYAWLGSLPILAFLVFVAPVLIDPLFERFEPLARTDPQLTAQLCSLAHSAGLQIPPSRIFLMHASEKVTTYNAYVTGFGATKRIVVWDTTARDLTLPQTLFVFGHEMGHYVLHHIYFGMAFAALLLLAGLRLLQWMAQMALRRWGGRWQIPELGAWSSLPLLMLMASILLVLSEPVGNAFSRWEEHAADAYGLAITSRSMPDAGGSARGSARGVAGNAAGEVAAQAFQLLGERSYSYPNPSPVVVFWSYSHPPIAERIRFVLSAWEVRKGGR